MTPAISTTKSQWSYYYWSFAATAMALVIALVGGGTSAMISVGFLIVLETSLSLDNAAVNARILRNWDARWRKAFLMWGILVAVFGMRILFPLGIVVVVGHVSPGDVVQMALWNPAEYSRVLTSAHSYVAGFGAAFLMMVGINYFFEEKHTYWLEWAESKLTKFGQIESLSAALVIVIMYLMRPYIEHGEGDGFFIAAMLGIATYVVTHGFGTLFGESDDGNEDGNPGVAGKIIRQGIMGFFYLEALDASFSFDGVIGAFAVTNYLPYIVLGLGAGAFFVRSFTVHMVDKDVMTNYPYLEHGAFYAILVLSGIMVVSATGHHIPEWITGLSGAAILASALVHSIIANRRERAAQSA